MGTDRGSGLLRARRTRAWARFAEEVRRVIDVLQEHPEIGARIEGDLRGLGLNRFPYTLIYDASPDVLRILVVAHPHRRPGYWRARTKR